ncbi:MAG TPA: DUF2255 family protein [Rhizomicrobium sp.]|jgi:hypothetical protein|nr:DUF2255 family protein [Rhizomicrobium sp.]
MAAWTNDELQKFGSEPELHVAALCDDGVTCCEPLPIWAVVVDGMLYARSYLGRKGRWYQAAMRRKAGRIGVAGLTKDVHFEPAAGVLDDRIDEAYRGKYGASSYLAPMIAPDARATTLRITPRD